MLVLQNLIKILAKRLNMTLLQIIGDYQCGFMAGKGKQEPSLLATYLIEDTQCSQ